MADNPYVNKVETADGNTLVDLTSDTATAGDVIEGKTLHLASGAPATGTLGDATTTAHGLMSAADKAKLDGIEANANNYSLPTMSPAVKGGAKVGHGLSVEDDALNLGPLTDSGSGASVQTDGCGIFGVTGEGWSEQATTTGKNLLEIDLAYIKSINTEGSWSGNAYTINGVVYTVNGDGSITIAGTATATSIFSIAQGNRFGMQADTLYALSGVESTIGNCALAITDNATYSVVVDNVGEYATYITSTVNNAQIYITVYAAVQTNTVLRPQFELGSTATSYEPYTGGKASPNPDYPQEIRVARGRNLISGLVQGTAVGTQANISKSGDSYTVSPVTGNAGGAAFVEQKVLAGVEYVVSGVASASIVNVRIYDNINADNRIDALYDSLAGAFSLPFTPSADGYLRFWIEQAVTLSDLQLELGSTPTPYVPYGSVGLEVKSGKNLLDMTHVLTGDGWNKANMPNTLEPSTQYTFSLSNNTSSHTYALNLCKKSTFTESADTLTLTAYIGNGESATFTTPADMSAYPYLLIGGSSGSAASASGDFQVEAGSTATLYEPYVTVTPVPLPSKGFAGAIGDYVDTLEVDSAGGYVWGCETAEKVYTGASGETWYGGNGANMYIYMPTGALAPTEDVLCSHWNNQFISSTEYLIFDGWTSPASASAFKTWLESNPMTVLYPLATPTTESGYIDLPELPKGATVSIPELEAIGVEWWVAGIPEIQEYGQAVQARLQSEIDEAEQAIADLSASLTVPVTGSMTKTVSTTSYELVQIKYGGLVYVSWRFGTVNAESGLEIGTIPDAFKPRTTRYVIGTCPDDGFSVMVAVTSNGVVRLVSSVTPTVTLTHLYITGVYCI